MLFRVTAILLTFALPTKAATFAYVSLSGENRIAVYSVTDENGDLKFASDIKIDSSPGSLVTSRDGKFLYASFRSTGELASFRIVGNKLEFINKVEAGKDPAFIALDRTGKYLLNAYYVASKVSVHKLTADGQISERPLQEIKTADKAHAILTDATNRFAFVPHTGPNRIFQFRFNQETGLLSANQPPSIFTGENTGPRQFAFHSATDSLFFDYEQGSAIARFELDTETGRLTFKQRLSTLPEGFEGTNSNARIEIAPNGRFVYVANRGHNSIAGFRVNQKTGSLSKISITPTEETPRGFTIHPSGRFLYAAGQGSEKVAAYRIDPTNGTLIRFATYTVGDQPWWITIANTSEI